MSTPADRIAVRSPPSVMNFQEEYSTSVCALPMNLKDLLLAKKSWHEAAIFDEEGCTVCSTVAIKDTNITNFLTAFDDRDRAISTGFMWQGKRFEVHRWHPPLVYGRRGLPSESEGIALLKGKSKSEKELFVVISYKLPSLSSREIPQLIEFFENNIGTVDLVDFPEINQQ
ncbi:hypothetical protein IE077_001619 [Cardiosporidium cionae]|uniref:Uncharacterized protein n=1 Tax=Cardiosporidium cionae TaxID=476202 RepID=A0ABQ7JCL6_9APIC|nr:hypothetical protein IE077_001619 [Cardiosporidium cionae]|eukprot:KAF8821757.1 hypothetical protein IE077_001619 [Cardiosporidium cionae]